MVKERGLEFFVQLKWLVDSFERRFNVFIANAIRFCGSNCSIVLFGSRARGDFGRASDFDVAFIVPNKCDRIEFMENLSKLRGDAFPLDIVVLKVGELEKQDVKKMLTPCKVLWNGLNIDNLC